MTPNCYRSCVRLRASRGKQIQESHQKKTVPFQLQKVGSCREKIGEKTKLMHNQMCQEKGCCRQKKRRKHWRKTRNCKKNQSLQKRVQRKKKKNHQTQN